MLHTTLQVRFSLVAQGVHAVRFFVEGSWLTVVVDDLIPVSASVVVSLSLSLSLFLSLCLCGGFVAHCH